MRWSAMPVARTITVLALLCLSIMPSDTHARVVIASETNESKISFTSDSAPPTTISLESSGELVLDGALHVTGSLVAKSTTPGAGIAVQWVYQNVSWPSFAGGVIADNGTFVGQHPTLCTVETAVQGVGSCNMTVSLFHHPEGTLLTQRTNTGELSALGHRQIRAVLLHSNETWPVGAHTYRMQVEIAGCTVSEHVDLSALCIRL